MTAAPRVLILTPLVFMGCLFALDVVHRPGVAGEAGFAFWAFVIVLWLASIAALSGLSHLRLKTPAWRRLAALAVPVLFGAFLFFLW